MSDQTSLVAPPNSAPAAPTLTLEQVAERLSPSQHNALSALIAGDPLKSAAKAAGVHRATLHRWITADPLFGAAYNAWQQEARESTKVKLLSVAQEAVTTVVQAIREGNHRVAYSLLKDLGLLTKLKDELTDPELLRQQIEIQQANQKRALDAQAQRSQPEPQKSA